MYPILCDGRRSPPGPDPIAQALNGRWTVTLPAGTVLRYATRVEARIVAKRHGTVARSGGA